jgi:hypothetical protein
MFSTSAELLHKWNPLAAFSGEGYPREKGKRKGKKKRDLHINASP